MRCARTGRSMSITGTAKDFNCLHGAKLLAEGDDFPVQAYQHGHAFGFQFHPDVTYAMMHRWTTRGCVRMESPGAQPRHLSLRRPRGARCSIERAWLKSFIAGWIAGAPRAIMLDAAE